MKRLLLLVIGLLMMLNPIKAQNESFRVVGYYPSWAIYDKAYFVNDIPADKLTHINYAFANISDEGEILLGDEWADTQYPYPEDEEKAPLKGNFHQLQLLKEANPNLKTLISIGGWSWSDNFSDVALTEGSREKFARSAVDFVVKYGFDGVDIDWEYPTGGGEPGNIERPEDTDNFVLFLAALREHLNAQGEKDGKEYLLTIALGSARSAYEPLDWSRIVPLLDFINVMTYDMSGGWSSVTGFNSPLYNSSPNPPEGGSIDSVVKALLKLGIPPEKLVVGVPFYGKAWKGVGSKNNGLHQPHRGGVEGDFDYRTIAQNYLGDYERFWDDKAKVPYLYNGEMMITYDDPESIGLKAAYVREQGLGGVMFWELSQDNGDLLTAIDETLNTP